MQMLGRRAGWVILVLSCVFTMAGCGSGDSQSDDQSSSPGRSTPSASGDKSLVSGLPDFSRLVRKVSPAVVNISALPARSRQNEDSNDGSSSNRSDGALRDWLRHFFDDENDGQQTIPPLPDNGKHVSLGSGVIISSDGYILTSRHVIVGAGQIVVKLSDRRQLVARVVGTDADSDVALLKVKAGQLPAAQVGDPDKLDVGAWVVAIGSPFGFETSVTAGIVSAKGRSLADNQYVPFLQTDVAINPGNSGGPLFDLAGEVVGINSQIYSQTGGYQGVSFAVPIDIAMKVARQLRDNGHVTRGWLGVQVQNVDRKLAQSFKLPRPEGALVARVLEASPAAKADVDVGDVILAFNGHAVDTAADLPPLVASVAPGETARLKLCATAKNTPKRSRSRRCRRACKAARAVRAVTQAARRTPTSRPSV